MLRRLIILVLGAALVSNVVAQQTQKFRFTVFANPCINWLSSDIKEVAGNGIAFGYDAGLTVDRFFADKYAFSTGVSIGTLGGKLKYAEKTTFKVHDQLKDLASDKTMKYNLQYINIPLGLKFKTNEIGYLTYFAELGISTHFNIKALAESNDVPATFSSDNISDNIQFFNMGYHFGGGAEYTLGGSTALVFGITVTNGFIDVTSYSSQDKDKITTSSIALRLGIMF